MKFKKYLILFLLATGTTLVTAPTMPHLTEREVILKQVQCVAAAYGSEVFYYVYTAMLYCESNLQHNVINYNTDGSYDYGVAQLNSRTFDFSRKVRGYDIRTARGNARVGAQYFLYLTRVYEGNLYPAVLAYNCGMGNVARGTVPDVTYRYALKVFRKALQLMLESQKGEL